MGSGPGSQHQHAPVRHFGDGTTNSIGIDQHFPLNTGQIIHLGARRKSCSLPSPISMYEVSTEPDEPRAVVYTSIVCR